MSKQYLFNMNILSKKEYNPLEVLAFYSGNTFYNANNNKSYESKNKEKVIWNQLLLPTEKENLKLYQNLPSYLQIKSNKKDTLLNARNILWEQLDTQENRVDSQFGRLFTLSIPHFLSQESAIELIKSFSKVLIKDGIIVDASLHQINKENNTIFENLLFDNKNDKTDKVNKIDYVCYLICTLRKYEEGRFLVKNREWNQNYKLMYWRSEWINHLNEHILAHDDENKKNWEKKLTIYPEYKELKNNKIKL